MFTFGEHNPQPGQIIHHIPPHSLPIEMLENRGQSRLSSRSLHLSIVLSIAQLFPTICEFSHCSATDAGQSCALGASVLPSLEAGRPGPTGVACPGSSPSTARGWIPASRRSPAGSERPSFVSLRSSDARTGTVWCRWPVPPAERRCLRQVPAPNAHRRVSDRRDAGAITRTPRHRHRDPDARHNPDHRAATAPRPRPVRRCSWQSRLRHRIRERVVAPSPALARSRSRAGAKLRRGGSDSRRSCGRCDNLRR